MSAVGGRCRRVGTDPLALTAALLTGAVVAAGLGDAPLVVWGCLAGASGHALSGSV
ncbi:MAG: hypothetical protein ACRDZO_01420 [Egibacteraceae bacterium]